MGGGEGLEFVSSRYWTLGTAQIITSLAGAFRSSALLCASSFSRTFARAIATRYQNQTISNFRDLKIPRISTLQQQPRMPNQVLVSLSIV